MTPVQLLPHRIGEHIRFKRFGVESSGSIIDGGLDAMGDPFYEVRVKDGGGIERVQLASSGVTSIARAVAS